MSNRKVYSNRNVMACCWLERDRENCWCHPYFVLQNFKVHVLTFTNVHYNQNVTHILSFWFVILTWGWCTKEDFRSYIIVLLKTGDLFKENTEQIIQQWRGTVGWNHGLKSRYRRRFILSESARSAISAILLVNSPRLKRLLDIILLVLD